MGNRKPTDSIQTAYSSTNETESYRLDDDTLGINLQFGGDADFSSRTPIVRMWTSLELQSLSEVRYLHKTDDDSYQRDLDKYRYLVRGSRVIENEVNRHDRLIYVVGNHNLNILEG